MSKNIDKSAYETSVGYSSTAPNLESLVGLEIIKIDGLETDSGCVSIYTREYLFEFYHEQECCEDVELCDFEGSPDDLVGGVVSMAEESDNDETPDPEDSYCVQWTFYNIYTNKGSLFMCWRGESNGYYSTEVDVVVRPRKQKPIGGRAGEE